jgi:hypothetical protein
MHVAWGIRRAAICLAVLLTILLAGCHSSARSIRKNPRVEPFDFQISVGQDWRARRSLAVNRRCS